MKVVVMPGYFDANKYPEPAEDAPKVENAFGRDLSAVRTEQKLDAIVLLQIRRYGTIRSYYGFIPLGAPSAFFEAKGQMVDLRSGALIWQTQMTEQQATVLASGDWDQPPSYPNLTAALRVAVANGSEFLRKEFFYPEAAPVFAKAPPPVGAPIPAAGSAPVPKAAAPASAAPIPAATPASSGPVIRAWSPDEGPYRPPGT